MNACVHEIATAVREVVQREAGFLEGLPEEVVSTGRNSQGRTIKELVGHLVDSSSNNHQRMVRLQYNERLVFPDYTQDNDRWIKLQDYNSAPWKELVGLWRLCTLHIARVMDAADDSAMDNRWTDFEGGETTLLQMMEGYLWHLELHMGQIHELAGEK